MYVLLTYTARGSGIFLRRTDLRAAGVQTYIKGKPPVMMPDDDDVYRSEPTCREPYHLEPIEDDGAATCLAWGSWCLDSVGFCPA